MQGPAERHHPVLLDRCVELIAPALDQSGSVFVDATLGMGGHSAAVLAACPNTRLIGIDRDRQALALAGERLAPFAGRIELVHAVYDEIADVLADLGLGAVQAVLMDLGVSSLQLDDAERGFAYAKDAPLDMRMDPSRGVTAAELVNTATEKDLTTILRRYGEERFAPRIARGIVASRQREPLRSSAQLVAVIRDAIPAAARRVGGNPAKRTFQALRIAVNDELTVLERALPQALSVLARSGRVVVLAYQSLEDRLVKSQFAAACASLAPPDLPVVPPHLAPRFRALTRGAERASETELLANSRAASVRLRAVERIADDPGKHTEPPSTGP